MDPDALAAGRADDPHAVPPYDDVVGEVRAELLARVDAAVLAGVDPARWCSTPAWASPRPADTTGHCCARCTSCVAPGFPVLVGASRKRFLGALLADATATARPPDGRETGHRGDLRAGGHARAPGGCGCTTSRAIGAIATAQVVAAWYGGPRRD